MEDQLRRRLEDSGHFPGTEEIHVSPVATDAFGEGEYEARFVYPPESTAPHARDFVGRLRESLEDALPRAWVVAFTLSSRRADGNDVVVTFDYVPEGARAVS